MSKNLSEIKFQDLLPSSIASDAKIQAAARVLDKELAQINQATENIFLYSSIEELNEATLKHLAWQWHVDFWDDALPLEKKRILIKQAYAWHKRKGTPSAVEEVIRDVLGGGSVSEWFEYGGRPFHFKVFSNSPPEDLDTKKRLLAAIDMAKNERSILDEIILSNSLAGNLHIAGLVSTGTTVTITN